MKEIVANIAQKSDHLGWGRDIIKKWSVQYINGISQHISPVRVLDIGAGDGQDLSGIEKSLEKGRVELFGIENYEKYQGYCRERGIKVININIENSSIPEKDGSFDLIIINQVIEHTKEIFWIFSEISRVLKKGGIVIVGVPNLAALHERILLLFGYQPRCIKVMGPHIRGFTRSGFRDFIQKGGYFRVRRVRGSHFWPFPSFISRILSRVFTNLSWSLFFFIERTEKAGNFIEILDTAFFETNFFRGT